jgi:hypothetical protein
MTQDNRRKYIRISTVLPVEFYILDSNGKQVTPWLQGFSRDLSRSGMGLIANDLWSGFVPRVNFKGAPLNLKINLPFKNNSIPMCAQVVWFSQKNVDDFTQYFLGLEFTGPDRIAAGTIFQYALFKQRLPWAIGALMVILSAASLSFFWKSEIAARENKRLVSEYVDIADKSASLAKVLGKEKNTALLFQKRQKELAEEISFLQNDLADWQKKYDSLFQEHLKVQNDLQQNTQASRREEDGRQKNLAEQKLLFQAQGLMKEKITRLGDELAAAKRENTFLKIKEQEIIAQADGTRKAAAELAADKTRFSRKVIEGMYAWIKNRQDLKTGLVLSYEGDADLDQMCFTYDQALAAILFIEQGDTAAADKILSFYLKTIKSGEDIFNAYYTQGSAAEYVVHCGPNAWLGLAVLTYIKKTGDDKYLPIAAKVSEFLLRMMDSDGGLKGGPKESWYSTEHNLDACAFFNLFYELKKEPRYKTAAQKIKGWINKYSYTQHGPPIKRGKGDATIATDTYAWSVAAFYPQELLEMKMNPDAILDFAVDNCEVEVKFLRPDQEEIAVKGFDFAKVRNTARGGVVSGEWTAQMILSFEIMADFYKDKDRVKYNDYLQKALLSFNELAKMVITSPSRPGKVDPCLPYASRPSADTGHGWRTPKGNSTGSLSSTAYFIFAYRGYNPLKAQKLSLSLEDTKTE